MKKLSIMLTAMAFPIALLAQETHQCPVRTPEEVASRQTEMLRQELSLTPAQYDTIYRIHLKYARLRVISNTRQEALQRLNKMTEEMLEQMTPKQQKLFLGKQMEGSEKRLQHHATRVCYDSIK